MQHSEYWFLFYIFFSGKTKEISSLGLEYGRRRRCIQVPQRHLKEDLHCVSPNSQLNIILNVTPYPPPKTTEQRCLIIVLSVYGAVFTPDFMYLLAAWRPWNETDKSSTNTTNTVTGCHLKPTRHSQIYSYNLKRTGILVGWSVSLLDVS